MPHKVIFIDTETTSLDTEKCGMIEIAGIIDIDDKEVDRFYIETNIFQGDLIEKEALEKNGTPLKEIYARQSPIKAYAQLLKVLKKYIDKFDKTDKFIAIGYVADFDNRVLRSFFKKNNDEFYGSWFWTPWIDVFNLAAYMYQDQRKDFENFKLETVARFLGMQIKEERLHDALYDANLTREMYYKLTK